MKRNSRAIGSVVMAVLAVAAAWTLRTGLDLWAAPPSVTESESRPAATAAPTATPRPAPVQAPPQQPVPAVTATPTPAPSPTPTPDPVDETPEGWMLRLVKPDCPLPEDFTVELAEVAGGQFDARAAGELERMLTDAKAAGCELRLVCGYRDNDRQQNLYEQKKRQLEAAGMAPARAADEAARWTPPGGCSEHNLGLGADLLPADGINAEALAWLEAHAAEYGFIQRYTEECEQETGMAPMSWHYRYVGHTAAARITEQGICLEEYREDLGQYGGR